MAASTAPAVGIDLGTSYSCIGVFHNGQVEIVPVDGHRLTPSCVFFTDRERLIGEDAKNAMTKNPANAVYQAKILLGHRFDDPIVQEDMKHWPFKVINDEEGKPKFEVVFKGETQYISPEEILAMILLKLKEGAEDYLGTTVTKVVITVPAFFNDSQRRATKDAATIAGFDVIRVLNEPTAAAFAYDLNKIKPELVRKVLIVDVGGCNVGVSILAIDDGLRHVKATAGETHLGGDDFVERMVIQFIDEIKRNSGKDVSTNKQALSKLRTACERVKRVLSSSIEAFLDVDILSEDIFFHSSMTRSRFEELNEDLFRSAIGLVDKTIQNAQLTKSEIDDVVVIGGSSRIPKIQKMLREYFGGKELITSTNPGEAVATGATIQAAILQGEKSEPIPDYLLLDVASYSIGIETAGGVMSPLIKRNSTIPIKHSQTFTYTQLGCCEKQNLLIKIYEGEAANAKDSYLLGVLELTGIPPAPRDGFEVEITFDIDENGVLKVFASDKTTGCEKRMKITNDHGHLSEEEVERMKIAVERYRLNDMSF